VGFRGCSRARKEWKFEGSSRTTHNLPFAPNRAITVRDSELEKWGKLLKKGDAILTKFGRP
jgi:hypothetical protein